MIEIQTGKIRSIGEVLASLIQDKSINRKQKYWFYRFTNKFQTELASYNKMYDDIVFEHCDKDANDKPIYLDKDDNITETNTGRISIKQHQGELNTALVELNNQKINIEFDKIRINVDELPESITAQMMIILDDIIDFADDMKPPLELVK